MPWFWYGLWRVPHSDLIFVIFVSDILSSIQWVHLKIDTKRKFVQM